MNIALKWMINAAALLAFSLPSFAADVERGTPEEAIALVHKAVEMLKKDGKDKLYAETNNSTGQFVKKDMYVFTLNFDGVCTSHGSNPRMVGKNLIDMKDSNGVEIARAFIQTATTKGKGWVDYQWPNKVTKEVEKKSTYVERVGDVILGVGIYRK